MIIDKLNINVCACWATSLVDEQRVEHLDICSKYRKIRAVMLVDLLIGLYNRIRKWAKNYGMKAVKTA